MINFHHIITFFQFSWVKWQEEILIHYVKIFNYKQKINHFFWQNVSENIMCTQMTHCSF